MATMIARCTDPLTSYLLVEARATSWPSFLSLESRED